MYSKPTEGDKLFTNASQQGMTAHCTHCAASWPLTGVDQVNRHDMGCNDCGSKEYYVKKGTSQRGA